jgi:hypothetical protein
MDRLHQEGYITDPRGKAKSVVLTEAGLERAQRLLTQLFGKQDERDAAAERAVIFDNDRLGSASGAHNHESAADVSLLES